MTIQEFIKDHMPYDSINHQKINNQIIINQLSQLPKDLLILINNNYYSIKIKRNQVKAK